ncbi:MAG: FAD-binding protein, partial [Marinilabiliaceae bacterium]
MERFENINLKQYNTFGISALADEMYNCYDEEEVHEALKRTAGRRRYVIGGGSNILLLGDFHGAIIRPLIGGVEIRLSDSDYTYVTAGAGVEWDDFVRWAIENGLYGVENLSGIPGHVGACPVQNIGAYGVEAKDVILNVEGVWTD